MTQQTIKRPTLVVTRFPVSELRLLCRILFERVGQANSSGAYQGPLYFTYEDEVLAERRRRFAEVEPE